MIWTLELITPECTLFSGEVHEVLAEDVTGHFGVRPRHEPAVFALVPGVLEIRRPDSEALYAAIGRGIMAVNSTGVSVVTRRGLINNQLDELRKEVQQSSQLGPGDPEPLLGLETRLLRLLAGI